MTDSHLILTVREVAKLLRIHRPKVYDLIKEGVLEGFKLGADWRVKRDSVEKLVGPIPQGFFDEKLEESSNHDYSANETGKKKVANNMGLT